MLNAAKHVHGLPLVCTFGEPPHLPLSETARRVHDRLVLDYGIVSNNRVLVFRINTGLATLRW